MSILPTHCATLQTKSSTFKHIPLNLIPPGIYHQQDFIPAVKSQQFTFRKETFLFADSANKAQIVDKNQPPGISNLDVYVYYIYKLMSSRNNEK